VEPLPDDLPVPPVPADVEQAPPTARCRAAAAESEPQQEEGEEREEEQKDEAVHERASPEVTTTDANQA
jgi:hypothetical protein